MNRLIIKSEKTLARGTCQCCNENSVKGMPRRYKNEGRNGTWGICPECIGNAFRWNDAHSNEMLETVDAISTDDHLVSVGGLTSEEAITLMYRFPRCNFMVVAKNGYGYTIKSKDEKGSCYAVSHMFSFDLKTKVNGKTVSSIDEYHKIVKNGLAW